MTPAVAAPVGGPPPSASTAERRQPRLLFDLAAVAVLALCALILHRDGLFGGPAFYELDTRLFYFPLAQWLGHELQSGVFPLWQPDMFTGYPIFADGELGLAYLPQVALLALLPAPVAMVWMRVLHVFLAGLFTYLLLRTLRLEPLPALGGALVFAFGSFVTAQMHHENVVRSAVWLPAVILCAERAERSRLVWTGVGALAFSQAALGLHVQPVLMLALALGLYVVFRAFVPPRNAYFPLLTGAGIVFGGLALAAIQWVPLAEWALVSSRRGGVDYEFGSAFAIAPISLASMIFPFFFRLPDATTWWSLWQQWEIELYVGIPTLALAIVGIVLSRRSEVIYFVVLGGLALWIAMAHYAPFVNVHLFLWSLPGFSFLRAPGRFSYLVVFAFACLAGFGLQVLSQRRVRISVALVGGLPSVALLAAMLALLPTWRALVTGDPARALTFVNDTYLATRAQYPIDPALVIQGLSASLDFATPKTAWSLALIVLTALGFVAWLALGYGRHEVGQALFVALLACDLLVFAYDFHPRAPLASLVPEPPAGLTVTPGTRVLLHDPVDLPTLEPNQLLAIGAEGVQGYSSLPSQRHVELDAATRDDPRLFDLWSAPFVVVPANPSDAAQSGGVQFRSQHPLVSDFGGAPVSMFHAPPPTATATATATALRVIGTLGYAFNVPQGTTVATLKLDDRAVPLRAGIELSERAYDRPSLRGLLQHQRANVAFDFAESTPEGEAYTAHLYTADIPLDAALREITVGPTDPDVQVAIFGMGLVDASGAVQSLVLADRDGLTKVSETVIQNTQALPRAFVVPRAQTFSPARHNGLTPTQLVASPDVDLHVETLVENDPQTPVEPSPGKPVVPATVEDLGPNAVRVHATADAPSYVVLDDFYQRGWTARVDGQPARVFIANALFRAVPIEPGDHVVEFRFEPQSLLIGGGLSVLALLVVLGAIVLGLLRARRSATLGRL